MTFPLNSKNSDFSISEISHTTGITPETLRTWERRYGFPDPSRNSKSERQYSKEHLNKLQLVKGLIDLGYGPKKVICLPVEELILLINKARAKFLHFQMAGNQLKLH